MPDQGLLTGEHFLLGDYAAAEGAILAGCRFFAGYPITPATEIAERMSTRLPQVDGIYIQMEDELASMNAILGASWAGAKSMTATSGPGFSLMMENLGRSTHISGPTGYDAGPLGVPRRLRNHCALPRFPPRALRFDHPCF
jgi:2-oxoglutarate ferredoxin oxidoreductase subunit alpha